MFSLNISTRQRRLLAFIFILTILLVNLSNSVSQAAGTISLTTLGSAYTQDFNTLALSGTSSTVPNGWDFSESGTNANTTYTAGTGSSNAGDTYSFGAAGNTERAFGGLLSGSLNPTIGASFTNNTGSTIAQLSIVYTGEQWRAGVTNRNAADRLDFQISTDATSLTTGTWADVDSLDLNSPNINTALGALNGNDTVNRTSINFTITGLSIADGAGFWIRWTDFNIASSDDGLAVDDFSLTPEATSTPTNPTGVGAANPDPVIAGNNTLLTVTVTPGANPTSTGLAVTGDLSTIGGSATQAFFDDGTNGDVTPGDDVFSFLATVSGTTGAGSKSLPISITDAQSRSGSATIDLTVQAANACEQSFTPIYAIQGSGSSAAITGPVTTQGVVVGDYEGPLPTLRGFYLQDLDGDSNAATSDGIFVFNGNNDNVSLGQVVRVTGNAGEFQNQTQISSSSIIDCGSTDSVAPVDVTLPVPSATFLEQYEGMLVRLPQTLYVTEHFQLGRFGQVVLSSEDRLAQPTNVVAPGAPAAALQATNDLNRIIVDDALNDQNPDPILFGRNGNPLSASNTLRGGDTATGIVGIMTYTWAGNAASGNAYRVRPINALNGSINFTAANPRPTSPEAVDGTLKVANMNLLNFFNTFDGLPDTVDNCNNGVGGAPTDCRGADTQAEFDRQWPKTVAAIVGTGADVIGLVELENDGYGPDSALQFLVDRLNDATAPGTYALIDVDAATGQVNALGLDAIKVGLIYKPASVTPVGQTAVLNSVAFVNGGDTTLRNRPSLAQAFQQPNGARVVVDVNHLKSKGSACDAPDAGDGQGNCNAVRTNAANLLTAWLASDPTGTGDPDVLITGDLNAYAQEDPVTAIKNSGYSNLIETLVGPDAYSFVFDGQWGYLDHALGSTNLTPQVTGVTEWHINADEPNVLDYNTNFKSAGQIASLYSPDQFRVSDHDPVLVGLNLNAPPDCSTAGPSQVSLWPPKHNFKAITILGVTDPDGDAVTITIDSIFQDESVDGDDDGSTSPDGEGVGTSIAEVRAERSGSGNGRVYHIGFTASDGNSNSCSGEVLVSVPLSQNSGAAVDDGALFDSTTP